MWQELGTAVALMLVLEGVFPFVSPAGVRATLRTLSELGDRHIRLMGLASMLFGLGLLYLIKQS